MNESKGKEPGKEEGHSSSQPFVVVIQTYYRVGKALNNQPKLIKLLPNLQPTLRQNLAVFEREVSFNNS
jgi:hypothetical protein